MNSKSSSILLSIFFVMEKYHHAHYNLLNLRFYRNSKNNARIRAKTYGRSGLWNTSIFPRNNIDTGYYKVISCMFRFTVYKYITL